MAAKGQTFATIRELAEFINDTPVPHGSIIGLEQNSSGHLDLIYDDGEFGYEAGTGGGTVSVPADAAVYEVSGSGTAGSGTIAIDGGDAIPVPANGTVEINLQGRKLGAFDIVFSANLDYYVSWMG